MLTKCIQKRREEIYVSRGLFSSQSNHYELKFSTSKTKFMTNFKCFFGMPCVPDKFSNALHTIFTGLQIFSILSSFIY